jgi:transporter family protein
MKDYRLARREEAIVGWLGFSLMALVLWGIWGFLSKAATQYLRPQAVYLLSILGHVTVVGFLLAQKQLAVPWHPRGVALALAGGVCMAFGLLSFFRALAGGPAIAVVPLTALSPMVTVVLAILLLHESFTWRHFAGVALALLAVWLLSK